MTTPAQIQLLATRMARVFVGNNTWHYTADFKNITLEASGKRVPKYEERKGPATIAEFVAHLKGEKGLLVIPITQAGITRWGKIDIDEYPTDKIKWAKAIAKHGLPLVVELSKSKGVHLAHYSPHNQSATDLRGRLADWAAVLRTPKKSEIFPIQEKLTGNEHGTGINLPYFGGDNKDTRNYAIDKDGERLSVAAWLDKIERMPAAGDVAPATVDVDSVVEILTKHWTDGQRDNLNLAVTGALLRAGVETGVIQEILDSVSGISADDSNRKTAAAIEAAMEKDKRVPGYPKLLEMIGEEDAKELMRLCGAKAPKDLVPFEVRPMPVEWLTTEAPPVVCAVEPLFPMKTVTVIAAEGGTGKTGFGLTAAIAVATGQPFFGLEVTQGKSVYIALEENEHGVHRRVRQIFVAEIKRMRDEGLSDEAVERFKLDLTTNFCPISGAGLELHLIQSIHGDVTIAEERIDRLIEKMPDAPVLVFMDPIARLHGTEENANQVGTALVNAAERIAQVTGAATVYQHHVGKDAAKQRDKGMSAARGASSLIAAARSSIRLIQTDAEEAKNFTNVPEGVVAAGDLIEVIHNKLNDGKRAAPFYLRRRELSFERFMPQVSSDGERGTKLLGALYAWYLTKNSAGFTKENILRNTDTRYEIFHTKVSRKDANNLIAQAISDGDLIVSDKTAPKTNIRLLVFREDFDVPM